MAVHTKNLMDVEVVSKRKEIRFTENVPLLNAAWIKVIYIAVSALICHVNSSGNIHMMMQNTAINRRERALQFAMRGQEG